MTAVSDNHPAGPKDPVGVQIVLAVASCLVLATVVLTFSQVVLRTVFNNPQAWAEEVSRYLFAWIVFLGTAVAFGRDTHIRIDFLDNLVSAAVLRVLKNIRLVVVLAAAGVMIYAGTLVTWRNRSSMFYTLPWFPQVVFYAVIPLCGILTVAFVLWRVTRPAHTDDLSQTKLG